MENTNIPKETAKDLFLHLLSAATFYISVIAFITLWWQYINFLFPDKLNMPGYGSSIYNTLLWATSSLAVAFPVYLLTSWIIGKDFKENILKRESHVRKWLWYVTLFISAMTMIIDLMVIVFNFLKGDLTIQFFLKLMVILVVASAVLGYFLWDLKKRDKISHKPKKLAWISGALIFVSIIYGFFLAGTPAKQRDIRFDEERIGNLQEIQGSILNYWQQKRTLPTDLNALKTLGFQVPSDPQNEKPYEYTITGDLSFQLCAEFKTATKEETAYDNPMYYYPSVGVATTPKYWIHEIGTACFKNVIDKDFFKEQNNLFNQKIPSPL